MRQLCSQNVARNSTVLHLFVFSVTSEAWKMKPTYQESGFRGAIRLAGTKDTTAVLANKSKEISRVLGVPTVVYLVSHLSDGGKAWPEALNTNPGHLAQSPVMI